MDEINVNTEKAQKNVQKAAVSQSQNDLIQKSKTVGVGVGIGSLFGLSKI